MLTKTVLQILYLIIPKSKWVEISQLLVVLSISSMRKPSLLITPSTTPPTLVATVQIHLCVGFVCISHGDISIRPIIYWLVGSLFTPNACFAPADSTYNVMTSFEGFQVNCSTPNWSMPIKCSAMCYRVVMAQNN